MINVIKKEALNSKVPIIQDEALDFIIDYIKLNNVKSILEIGTAVGYSAISFAMQGPNVCSIERDKDMYEKALLNVKQSNMASKINLIKDDALTYDGIKDKYDLIFIDAAKSQYINFFNKYSKYLKDDGVIICDNINFHNLDVNKVSRSTRQLIRKINDFKDFLKNNPDFKTEFYNVGDGMSVSKKNEEFNNDI